MNIQKCFNFIVNQVHSAVFATVDSEGRPVTSAIDIMDYDENGLYFLTAKGKNFYDRLKANEQVAFTAMKGEDTLSCVAVSVQGNAKEIGSDRLPDLFRKNPYMEKIYPDMCSRSTLTVFQIYEGTGEWFDLSRLPIERASFSFGGAQAKETGYFVTGKCIGCKLCYPKCPQKCIDIMQKPVVIQQEHCLRCGNCFEICPARAIERRQ
ncbi:4Fe-4S binding protein [Pseudoflavonifractor gallinarum]|uniref:pyridoxamine 5'-phosphate oxidase family protein n=1 Tax=Eubacteriales TaxID=186802 RepID=UPI001898B6D9|nr:4Fe-4S binding protein [Clostridium sp. J1101437_171009_A5]